MFASCELCVLPRDSHLYWGVLPSVVCRGVIEEAQRGGQGPLGLSSHERGEKVLFIQRCVTPLLFGCTTQYWTTHVVHKIVYSNNCIYT